MISKLEVNQNTKKSIQQIANVLNNEILLDMSYEFEGNGFVFRVETLETVLEYFEIKKEKMIEFLKHLKEKLIVKNDIDLIIKQLVESV